MNRTWLVVDDEIADTFILRRAIKDSALPCRSCSSNPRMH